MEKIYLFVSNLSKYEFEQVPNILVIGHSCCGGIRALMSMQDEVNSRFVLYSTILFICLLVQCLNCAYLSQLYIFVLMHCSSFIRSWVVVGKNARLSTKAVASNLSFDQQCRHCEKVSFVSLIILQFVHKNIYDY